MGNKGMKKRLWADEEIGYIQDSLDEPVATVAERLGRSVFAVSSMRGQVRRGYAGSTMLPWAAWEDEIVISSPALKAYELAALLPGRTVGAITQRRHHLRAPHSFIPGMNPNQPAGRLILAKTCLGCGLLLPAQWFWSFGWQNSSPQCRSCLIGKRKEETPAQKTIRRDNKRAYRDAAQAITLPLAENHRQDWTLADCAVLEDKSLSDLDKALKLKRTYLAVVNQMTTRGLKPRPATYGDPRIEQWIIDNPNASRVEEISAIVRPSRELVSAGNVRPEFEWDD